MSRFVVFALFIDLEFVFLFFCFFVLFVLFVFLFFCFFVLFALFIDLLTDKVRFLGTST